MAKTINEVARMGGKTTLARYGREHYQKIGHKGVLTLKAKYGLDYFKKIRRGEKVKLPLDKE